LGPNGAAEAVPFPNSSSPKSYFFPKPIHNDLFEPLLSGFGRWPLIVDSTRMVDIDKYRKTLAICAENIGDWGAVFCGAKCEF
jgi:hypothetical protein